MSAPTVKTTQALSHGCRNLHSLKWPAGGTSYRCRKKSDCMEVNKEITHGHFPDALLFQLIVILTQNYAFCNMTSDCSQKLRIKPVSNRSVV